MLERLLGYHPVSMQNLPSPGQQKGGGDLRKTARGASSPAKPALHIPELHSYQFEALSLLKERWRHIPIVNNELYINRLRVSKHSPIQPHSIVGGG